MTDKWLEKITDPYMLTGIGLSQNLITAIQEKLNSPQSSEPTVGFLGLRYKNIPIYSLGDSCPDDKWILYFRDGSIVGDTVDWDSLDIDEAPF